MKSILISFVLVNFNLAAIAQANNDESSSKIRVNQIGYYPNAAKKAVIADHLDATTFQLIDVAQDTVIFNGTLSNVKNWELSGEAVKIADFTEVATPGNYKIFIDDLGYSHPFEIKNNVLHEVLLGSVKGLYYQRSGSSLQQKHAGKWHREMGHPDTLVSFHESSGKHKGAKASPKGWYDAGDYNKYVINGSFPLGQFFLLHEQYPNLMEDGSLNIPESGNGTSDYLDELKYEFDWLLTMQDDDGGLFHKLTTKKFEGMVMPEKAQSPRFIVGKSTTATLDFAACAAQAYRVCFPIDSVYANHCLSASKKAYNWAKRNPEKLFENPEDISTGEYGDDDVKDEWLWANAELFVSTKDTFYLNQLPIDSFDFEFRPGESWTGFMRFLGVFSILESNVLSNGDVTYRKIEKGLLNSAERLLKKAEAMDYFQPIDDFQWGSNSDVLNAAMLWAQAYRLTKEQKYLKGTQQAMDYVLGNNAVGVSFVTGFGDNSPMYIHHRQSTADGIAEPVPGLLSGGPNSRRQDEKNGTVYPKNVAPMKSWVDQEPSYASNEICLNWNAPLTYILGFLEVESK